MGDSDSKTSKRMGVENEVKVQGSKKYRAKGKRNGREGAKGGEGARE
jgi:hypothetical protein